MKKGLLFALLLLLMTSPAFALEKWCGFKGLYIGMSAQEANKIGFTQCRKAAFGQICGVDRSNAKFKTIGGAEISNIEIGLTENKVTTINIETSNVFWDELLKNMKAKYGAPKASKHTPSYTWSRGGAEFIARSPTGRGVVEVLFGYDDIDIQSRKREHKTKKDF